MKALSNMGFALFGAALVAISYGLARFAFGLFVPSISAELSLTSYLVGIIGALPFISFVLSTLVAPHSAYGFCFRDGLCICAVLAFCSGSGGYPWRAVPRTHRLVMVRGRGRRARRRCNK